MPGKFPSLLALVLVLRPIPVAGQVPTLDKAQRIGQALSHYQKLGYFNGAILVADHGKIIYANGFGEADMASHAPNHPQTKFGVAPSRSSSLPCSFFNRSLRTESLFRARFLTTWIGIARTLGAA